jgi:hypothetical protein
VCLDATKRDTQIARQAIAKHESGNATSGRTDWGLPPLSTAVLGGKTYVSDIFQNPPKRGLRHPQIV